MSLMKNKELRRDLTVYLLVTAVLSVIGFIFHTACGILMLLAGLFFALVHFLSVYKRYKEISELSYAIDKILHGQEELLFSESREGELAILSSEIQKMTVRLKEQADNLQSDKLRLSDAIADISHQLRTPLTSMNLTVFLLSEEDLTKEKRIKLARELKKSLQRIDWLIEALLKISKIDAGTVRFRAEKVPIGELVAKAAAPLAIPMELRNQTLHVSVGEESFTGDLLWSAEALGNVLKNCMEHTPLGGTVEISANETPLFTEIVISDSGDGFDPVDIPHLFERFYKGKNASMDSVGIGLALAHMVFSAQNGVIRASNGKKGGAVFTIRFYKGAV